MELDAEFEIVRGGNFHAFFKQFIPVFSGEWTGGKM
jgi:hypothetical protein